jgi:hypothetical protein
MDVKKISNSRTYPFGGFVLEKPSSEGGRDPAGSYNSSSHT